MWLTYSNKTNTYKKQGLTECADGQQLLFYSNTARPIAKLDELENAEYQQAIELNLLSRQVRFGRDYLGHYPLFHACVDDELIISDDLQYIRDWLLERKRTVTVSEFALALYMTMGYIPQGYTLFNEIHSCRNASLYQWRNGKISEIDTFKPVEISSDVALSDIGNALEAEIQKIYAQEQTVDVWCSGGIDSSIIALLCNQQGRVADLLTLRHEGEFKKEYDEGELPYVWDMQKHIGAELREVEYSPLTFNTCYYDFLSLHPAPVIEPIVTPKYMLARKTRKLALTGEGGDPLFAGVKNNTIAYALQQSPGISIGQIYAYAHRRFYSLIPQMLADGDELQEAVSKYMQEMWDRYPGDMLRKLFYINTFEKQGGMLFPKNYYAGKYAGVRVLHPLTSLSVYKAAFGLSDEQKYQYPNGKLALIRLYGDQLPSSVVNRKKTGTLVPMRSWLKYIRSGSYNFDSLIQTGHFSETYLSENTKLDASAMDNSGVFLTYGLLTLSNWLDLNGGTQNATRDLSLGTCNL